MPLNETTLIRVKEILEQSIGKKNAIPSQEIAKIVDIDPGASNVRIRQYITEVVRKYGLPIASAGTKGYFFIESEDELNDYIDSLTGRINEINNRINSIKKNYRKYYGKKPILRKKMKISKIDIFFE